MKILSWTTKITALWLGLLAASAVTGEDNSPYQYLKNRELVAFVEAAATAVHRQRERPSRRFARKAAAGIRRTVPFSSGT